MQPKQKKLLKTIFWSGLFVGYLDITSAIINFMFLSDKSPVLIFNYIASAAFGKERAYANNALVIYGVLFHFLVAYCFTIFFLVIYPHLRFLSVNRLLTGILYGSFVWCIMNLLIVPHTLIHKYPVLNAKALIQAGILIVAIGIPLSYIAYWLYHGRKMSR